MKDGSNKKNFIAFTIIVVSYNPGEKLEKTLLSISSQEYHNYEVIIKDGASKDDSLKIFEKSEIFSSNFLKKLHIYSEADNGIYDAMNVAVAYKKRDKIPGDFIMFLNCGDSFHDKQTLGVVADYIYDENKALNNIIYYGDQYNLLTSATVSSAPRINEFALYRNVPCHQVCFYSEDLFDKRAYDLKYKVRADYEHFLFCIYESLAKTSHIDLIISDYEGGGYSETKDNRRVSAAEHYEITNHYMGKNAKKYRIIMALSGAPIRTWLAENPKLSGIYNKVKSLIYKR